MVLDHLHVHQVSAYLVGQAHPVSRDDEAVGAGLEGAAQAPRCQDDRVGPEQVEPARHELQGEHALADPVVHGQGGDEPLLVDPDACLHQLLMEDVEHDLAGDVGHEEGARSLLPTEAAGAEPAVFVPVEGDAHMLKLDNGRTSFLRHDLDGVLVTEIVAALDGREGVLLPGVAAVREGGVDPPLRGVGVAAHGVDLGDDGNISAVGLGSEGSAHPCEPCPYDDYIVIVDHVRSVLRPRHTFAATPSVPRAFGVTAAFTIAKQAVSNNLWRLLKLAL